MQDFQAIFTRPSISIIRNAGLIHHHHEAYSETTGIISTTLMETCLSLQCFTESTHESLIANVLKLHHLLQMFSDADAVQAVAFN